MTHPVIRDLENRYTAKKYDSSKRVAQADLDVIYEEHNPKVYEF